ncbi:hypothetical protein RS3R2_04320 [Pseudomonas lactis]|nr:hypothetical protein RS3R2_04320 [Pseudomonas lactis]
MLAKNVNDDACSLNKRGACEFFASKLAPTISGVSEAGVSTGTPLSQASQLPQGGGVV